MPLPAMIASYSPLVVSCPAAMVSIISLCSFAACTLLKAVYVLKTQLGVSESFYKYSELSPIYEQAKVPLYFGAISAPFYSISMKNVLKVLTFYPDGSVVVWIYMISFVDNTSGSANGSMLPYALPPDHYTDLATHCSTLE